MIVAGVMVRLSRRYPNAKNIDEPGEPVYLELHGVELNEAFNEGIDSATFDRDAARYLKRLDRSSWRAWRRFKRDAVARYKFHL